ncbi:hypothetical protein [Rhodococcus qingshengii]|uniref:hypothetical protein n=1 Tax=Rhodococcus qingshengii TaxID=334542 RepID=UPI0035DB742C
MQNLILFPDSDKQYTAREGEGIYVLMVIPEPDDVTMMAHPQTGIHVRRPAAGHTDTRIWGDPSHRQETDMAVDEAVRLVRKYGDRDNGLAPEWTPEGIASVLSVQNEEMNRSFPMLFCALVGSSEVNFHHAGTGKPWNAGVHDLTWQGLDMFRKVSKWYGADPIILTCREA